MKKSFQHTITNSISCSGIGVHSGKISTLTFHPLETDKGIIFKRVDITDRNNIIKANYQNIHKTTLGTTLINEDNVEIATIEHLMAALWGANIDNCLIEIDNVEIPVFDGSSEPFIFLLQSAGIQKQNKHRKFLKILKKVFVKNESNSNESSIEPNSNFIIDFTINFMSKAIGKQTYNFNNSNDSFLKNISRARTFGHRNEVEYMHKNNLALGGSLENAVVVDNEKVLNPEGLRYHDEFVRHKILDCIGDLYLAGIPILGKFSGHKSGHDLNSKLLNKIFSDESNYQII